MASKWREALQAGLGSHYQIRQELGGGGMSSTFVAEEVSLGRSVVLKVLSPELASGLSAERFEREIQLAARLQHAFVVPLLSAGVTDGIPWYTMPLVQGESLRARIAREGALTPTATARILRDVAEALAHAHAQGVVHRDIKPDNILLSGAHALVTDFGVAKAISASTTGAGVTATGVAIGTPAYMAPEQAAGDPNSDHRADLYALGATAYEMLTGRQLFGDRSPTRMLIAHATENPDPLSKVAPTVPPELASLVDQLLAKHPNDRPAHAQDLADALNAMLTRWTSGELPPATTQVTLVRALALWGVTFVSAAGAAWLGVRWLPIPDWTFPAAVLVSLAGLPAVLLSVWLHRPARPIAAVPSVASSTTVGRIEAIARPHFTWRRVKRLGLVALGIVVLLAATWAGSRALGIGPAATLRARGTVAADDRVFVADFDSPPSDTGLGLVVSDLLRTELSRSASIRLVTSGQRQNTLVAMARPTTARIGSTDAREFSQRSNAKVFLSGNVTQLGTGYLLRAALVESSTGNELASFTGSATSADDVIRAIDKMGREIRGRIGASLREVRTAPRLYWTVTPSLESARLYTEASRHGERSDFVSAVRALERAVAVDTEFAEAYRRMSAYYVTVGDRERQAWAGERAFRFREKLSLVLQKLVEGTYYSSPLAYDLDKSIDAYEAAIESFPRPLSPALNNVALHYTERRDFERAVEAFRRNLQVDSTSIFAPLAMISALWVSGKREEAREYLATKAARWLAGSPRIPIERARLASAELRPDSGERILLRELADSGVSPVFRSYRSLELSTRRRAQGMLAAAMRDVSRFGALNPTQDTAGRVPYSVLVRAEVLSWERENQPAARKLLDSIVAARPPGNASAIGYKWLEVATAYALAGDPAKAKALVATYEQRANVNTKRYDKQELELTHGWIAVAERRYMDAITAFREADVGACTICALAPLALAYDLAGRADSAITLYERYLSTNYYYRDVQDQRYLAATYKRLGELYDAKQDAPKAREYYERFVDLWKNADPELQPKVQQVRRRLAMLRAPD